MPSLPEPPDATPPLRPQPTPSPFEQRPAVRPFRRSSYDKKIAGLCGGFAQYVGWDATLVRLLVVVGVFMSGGALALAYVVGWFIVPLDSTTTTNQSLPSESAGNSG
jgi:phage shock protein C